ncbi:putative disease resistance RPP8-like protein 2 isoform X2 [Salvia divinorum]|uniref:Disease resistance RPP8-like protein 2 isoform X2 n=1 Tax=Salvia divinorum TaxID=28513 RepID=A0ABD1GJK9_SALDI
MDASHTAEDVIESYIIDTIQLSASAPTDDGVDGITREKVVHFYQDLQNVIEEIDLINKEVAGITREKGLMMCFFNSWIDLLMDVPVDKSSLS